MQELQKKARQSLQGDGGTHRAYSTTPLFISLYITDSHNKRKKVLEERYGKLVNLKPFSDDIGIVDNSQQKFVKQLRNITDEEGLKTSI